MDVKRKSIFYFYGGVIDSDLYCREKIRLISCLRGAHESIYHRRSPVGHDCMVTSQLNLIFKFFNLKLYKIKIRFFFRR